MTGIDLYRAIETTNLGLVLALAIAAGDSVSAESVGTDTRSIDTGATIPVPACMIP